MCIYIYIIHTLYDINYIDVTQPTVIIVVMLPTPLQYIIWTMLPNLALQFMKRSNKLIQSFFGGTTNLTVPMSGKIL